VALLLEQRMTFRFLDGSGQPGDRVRFGRCGLALLFALDDRAIQPLTGRCGQAVFRFNHPGAGCPLWGNEPFRELKAVWECCKEAVLYAKEPLLFAERTASLRQRTGSLRRRTASLRQRTASLRQRTVSFRRKNRFFAPKNRFFAPKTQFFAARNLINAAFPIVGEAEKAMYANVPAKRKIRIPEITGKFYPASSFLSVVSRIFPKQYLTNRFIELQQKALVPMQCFLQVCRLGKCTGISIIDSTPIRKLLTFEAHDNLFFLLLNNKLHWIVESAS
jgi:hypothetical protein